MINPTKRKIRGANAGIGWWMVLAVHALIFALVMMFFPEIQQRNPDLFTDNRLRLLIPVWGLFLLGHLLYVLVVDARISVKRKRDAHIIKRVYELPDPRRDVPQLPAGTYIAPLDDEYTEDYDDISYTSAHS